MNNAQQKIADGALKKCQSVYFFVGKYVPFVRQYKAGKVPFVGINRPNIVHGAIANRVLGFSLIELVVTMLVAVTLISLAVPSFRTLTQNNRMSSQVNDLIADLSYARSEAIKRRTPVTICASSDGATCTGGGWAVGRLIGIGAPIAPLRYRGPSDTASDTLTSDAPDPFSFDARGGVPLGGFRFTFCDVRGVSDGKRVLVNNIGQATLDRTPGPLATCL